MAEKEDIKREFIHATYCKSNSSDIDDLVVVKEHLHMPDGTIEPNLRFIENYERKFYITLPEHRNHETKKEFEHLSKLEEYRCNQARMPKMAGKLLGMYGARSIYDVNENPFIYGSDITPPVLLAQEYSERWPELMTDATLAILDYETDVLNGTEMIISGCLSMKNRVHIAITEEFLGDLAPDANRLIRECTQKHLGKYMKERNIELEISICKNAAQVVVKLMQSAHAWAPDFIGYWNMKFDVEKMIHALDYYGVPKEIVFSDPKVPPQYRKFNWRPDSQIKVIAGGKQMSKHHCDLWHKLDAPANFYHVCLMCLFKRVRVREQQRNSYGLDPTLDKEVNLNKLKFDNIAEGLTSLDWHIEMQRHHKIEYMVYMQFDCIGVEILDEKNGDCSRALRPMAGISELTRVSSTPRMLQDNMHFILRDENKVIGSTSGDMTEEFDKYTPDKTKWIITLAAELQVETGRRLINEYPLLETNIATFGADTDVKSAYPTTGSVGNVSKGTTRIEVCSMGDGDTQTNRSMGINMTGLKTNALELAGDVYDFPSMEIFLAEFEKEVA